jgi:formate--tetrahydrofolate ligase
VLDMNDRALRQITVALGGPANGYPREDGFDIVVASEVMAIFCLATSISDLKERLGNIVCGYTKDQKPILAKDLKCHGAMAALLKDALAPNLVQTLEHAPAFIHGGPFANIAHGCNSVLATQTALKLGDYVVTEAGFGADLGAEKFVDIKCRKAGLRPAAVVLVATIRALKYHGGVDVKELGKENLEALAKGITNIERHVNNIRNNYGLPCVVSINHRTEDTDAEVKLLQDKMAHHGAKVILARHWAEGGKGAVDVAKEVVRPVRGAQRLQVRLRRAGHALGQDEGDRHQDLRRFRHHRRFQGARADQEAAGIGLRPLPDLRGEDAVLVLDRSAAARRALGHVVNIREVRLAAGAEFIVMICGDIMTMPGLPKVPSAVAIDVTDDGKITGLF